ncbi:MULTISPECIES: BON domain-containing protein [unclassified Variovorax]|jgi:osmotically-inducible protein OsmY|uniref:BON domain-containing protein n=1 Tax=unclassified Variovorax TaxID=663243 RepID=UPI002B226D73|nr:MULTISPECIES: BON domain-containing protein [unclassified Variovorax]MEB0059722.1 BON domain-containing protein [Variovorax sp. LG9.2]MEB0114241.1 BON domain-containing protein [Variovorax sp. RTB1]
MKTDMQIKDDVLAELKWDPAVNAATIGVEVKDGVVTLAGHVSTYAEKYAAERVAQRVFGVKALAVEMDVKMDGHAKRTDADIAKSAESALQWTTFLTKSPVMIKVEKGWLTLTGEVEWEYQRKAAELAVRYLLGVTGVSNQITIKPSTSVAVVKSDIEAALKRRANADAASIAVTVNGTKVTLSGTARSWSDRELAVAAAWAAPGVYNVQDDIAVV